jgi:hypothetical protein
MRNLMAVLGFLALIPTLAMGAQPLSRLKSKLNLNIVASDGSYFRLGDQLTIKKPQVMKLTYDTSKTGMTSESLKLNGAHAMKDADNSYAVLPEGAVIKEAWMDVRTGLSAAAGTSQFCFQVQGTCDLKLNQSIQGYQKYGATAFRQILPKDGTTTVKLTADRFIYGVVSGGALNGGTVNLFIEYFLSD